MTKTLQYYTEMAKDTLKGEIYESTINDYELCDRVHAITKDYVPVFCLEILEVASRDVHIALEMPGN